MYSKRHLFINALLYCWKLHVGNMYECPLSRSCIYWVGRVGGRSWCRQCVLCRIGDACKQGMIRLFRYLPEGEKLLAKTKTRRTSKKRVNFAFLLFRNKTTLQNYLAYSSWTASYEARTVDSVDRYGRSRVRVDVYVWFVCIQYKSLVSNSVDYRATEKYNATQNRFLDPHHTHFILVDSSDPGSEVEFRSKFESRHIYGRMSFNCRRYRMFNGS